MEVSVIRYIVDDAHGKTNRFLGFLLEMHEDYDTDGADGRASESEPRSR